MNGPWRSLGAAWRHNPALALWPHAVAGVREWQQALTEAAPRAMAIDAWPREADVDLLLQPLAQSPLQGSWQVPLAGGGGRSVLTVGGGAAGAVRTAAGSAARFASMTPAEPGNAAALLRRWKGAVEDRGLNGSAPPHSVQSVSGLTGPEAWPSDRAGGSGAPSRGPSRPPSRESTRAATPQASVTPALVAALLARFAAGQPPPFAGPAGAAPRLAHQSALLPLGHAAPAFGNVVPLRGAAGLQLKHRAAPDATPTSSPALTWRHWSAVLGRVASGAFDASGAPAAPEIAALLARGERAFVDAAAAPDAGWLAAAAALRPTVQALQPTGPVATATTPVQRGPGSATGTATGTDVPSTPAAVADGLAGLSAAMARIENQLAAAAQTAAPAPVAPQWLSDDDTLAERIHDILRRQARRHGIDTP